MKFTAYIQKHHVFTTAELEASVESPRAAREQLRLAVKKGTVTSVRRGLYVSRKGYFEDVYPDSFLIPWTADPKCIFAFHSALELYGVAHNISFECQFHSEQLLKAFSFNSVRYKPFSLKPDVFVQTMRRNDFVLRLTTKEQTLMDCLERPAYAGGLEEVLRSLSSLTYLDFEALGQLLGKASETVCARVGWLLEAKRVEWRVPDEFLEGLRGRLHSGPYLMGSSKMPRHYFLRNWHLYFPSAEEEVLSWIQH